MEAGLTLIDENYFLVCVTAILDKEGKYFLGISSKKQLPIQVSEEIRQGKQSSASIREYYERHQENKILLKEYISSLVSRGEQFIESIQLASLSYMFKMHFS